MIWQGREKWARRGWRENNIEPQGKPFWSRPFSLLPGTD